MNFSEHPPSKQWAALKYRGAKFAEVWFKPDGEPCTLTFRIPQESFALPEMDQLLTLENLLMAVALTPEEVESWDRDLEWNHPLPPPPRDVSHLTIHVRLKPSPRTIAPTESGAAEILAAKWQDLEARFKAIETLEVTLDSLRQRMEGLRSEMENASRKMLSSDEKVHALNSDVAQWNKAKSRVHYALPKVKEFIHRATWALATPERKKLEELFKNHGLSSIPSYQIDKVREQLENMLKDRQILSAQGVAVSQECQSISAEIQGSLRTLQSNAATRARASRGESRAKGKFF